MQRCGADEHERRGQSRTSSEDRETDDRPRNRNADRTDVPSPVRSSVNGGRAGSARGANSPSRRESTFRAGARGDHRKAQASATSGRNNWSSARRRTREDQRREFPPRVPVRGESGTSRCARKRHRASRECDELQGCLTSRTFDGNEKAAGEVPRRNGVPVRLQPDQNRKFPKGLCGISGVGGFIFRIGTSTIGKVGTGIGGAGGSIIRGTAVGAGGG